MLNVSAASCFYPVWGFLNFQLSFMKIVVARKPEPAMMGSEQDDCVPETKAEGAMMISHPARAARCCSAHTSSPAREIVARVISFCFLTAPPPPPPPSSQIEFVSWKFIVSSGN